MKAPRYADKTEVPVSKTRAELEDLLSRHGATSTAVFNSPTHAAIAFEMHERRILMKLALPNPAARELTHEQYFVFGKPNERPRSADGARRAHENACRQKWRALLLAVKAKLVSVSEGVETFEDAFMAHVVMPDGQTVADHVRPRIASAYSENKMVPLLPYGGPSNG